MIIIKLNGGLGNQMFQYALGRKISLTRNITLKMDPFWYAAQNFPQGAERAYGLGVFNIVENLAIATEVESFPVKKSLWRRGINKIKREFFGLDDTSRFNPRILKAKDGSYLEGYWQSEKYFIDIRDNLLQEFTLKKDLGLEAQKIIKEIDSFNSVSLHIRRGDYLSDQKVRELFGVCSLDYYNRAVDFIKDKVEQPVFFVFSDDINWARENLKLDFPVVFVSRPEIKDYEELILLSHCRHNIIAN
ncbi:MAG: alpha-1,2-fucosyltransferase, partial [Patescibacteria group bacterium]